MQVGTFVKTLSPHVVEILGLTGLDFAAIDAARTAGKIPAMFVATAAERDRFAAQGVTWFIVGSDQSLLRQAAQGVAAKPPDRRP